MPALSKKVIVDDSIKGILQTLPLAQPGEASSTTR